ncbi:unnamed protein product [Lampetra fluviatilis]
MDDNHNNPAPPSSSRPSRQLRVAYVDTAPSAPSAASLLAAASTTGAVGDRRESAASAGEGGAGFTPEGVSAVAVSVPPGLLCLVAACEAVGAWLEAVPFGSLDFGEADVLDAFYNADVAVVEMSDFFHQPSLLYHLGVRESFDMTNNIVLYSGSDPDTLKVSKTEVPRASCGSCTFVPYSAATAHGVAVTPVLGDQEGGALRRASLALHHLNWDPGLGALCVPLADRLQQILQDVQVTSSVLCKDAILGDIRRARGKYQGEELARELARIRSRLDTTELLSPDIVINLLLSYRDLQDYDSMVKLVETLDALPTCDLANQNNIKFHYAFALNRRGSAGDREKALSVMRQVVEGCEQPPSDMLCLCGRIYKDKFMDSGCSDTESRDSALEWYRKAFDVEPSLYSGIHLASLLIASGQDFEGSPELRKIGMKLNSLLGRKGSLEKLSSYWDVGLFMAVSLLAGDHAKATQAADKLYRLHPPPWYVRSVVQNGQLILRHMLRGVGTKAVALQSRLDFWIEFMNTAGSLGESSTLRFPVLIFEGSKVYQPSYVSVNGEAEEKSFSLWHVEPRDLKKIHEWNFKAADIRGVSISKCDERCCFLYVSGNSDDFQICFSSESQAKRFHDLAKEVMEERGLELEAEVDCGVLEWDYDYNENEEKLVLGRGTFGTVYAGRDLSNQVRIAIKEVPEKDHRYSQPLHEEIALHKHLKHRNIVRYLGSVSEGGFFKIFMEQVPGGSLSALLRSKWGPLKDNETTIAFYTKQILEGLQYLHENQIVHRDIKGDNVLINTYSGVLKISDFGTSKRLAGLNPSTETFTGTLQYMAPEIIDRGPRGYGKPADIWSLGCTIIEMATGKPPFYELGEPQAAMFKVGMFKIHPEIPESMSEDARAFILRCFQPEPDSRAAAAELLADAFLRSPPGGGGRARRSKGHVARASPSSRCLAAPDYGRSVSVPVAIHVDTSSTGSERGSSSSESESRTDPLAAPRRLNNNNNNPRARSPLFLGLPEDSSPSYDHSAPPSPEERDPGLFLLRKDSERRATLHRILTAEQELVAANLRDILVAQGAEEPRLSAQHVSQLMACLREYMRSPDRKAVASAISALKLELDFDSVAINQLQVVLFGFQDAVNRVLKNHNIKPHWMFALDSLIRRAVQVAITTLIPELQSHFGPVVEDERERRGKPGRAGAAAADGEVDDDDDDEDEEEDRHRGGVVVGRGQRVENGEGGGGSRHGIQLLLPPPEAAAGAADEGHVTSGVSTLSSTLSHDALRQSQVLSVQLGRLKIENSRLLEELIDKEREYQTLLQLSIQQRSTDIEMLRTTSKPIDIPNDRPRYYVTNHGQSEDPELVSWLRDQGVSRSAIDKFVEEDYSLQDILGFVSREDLKALQLRGGTLCRIWTAILEHRQTKHAK